MPEVSPITVGKDTSLPCPQASPHSTPFASSNLFALLHSDQLATVAGQAGTLVAPFRRTGTERCTAVGSPTTGPAKSPSILSYTLRHRKDRLSILADS